MSKISYPQLVKNIADTFRAVTGTTDPIVIGELTNKISETISSGSGEIQKPILVENSVEVILPVIAEPLIAKTSNNVIVETSVVLESEE